MHAFAVVAGLSLLAASILAVTVVTTVFLSAMARLEQATVSEPARRPAAVRRRP